MNLAEAMLTIDAEKITKEATKEFEVDRLSKLFGEPFIIHLKEIPFKRMRDLQNMSVEKGENGMPVVDSLKLQLGVLCAGVSDNAFKNMDVLKHYGVNTKKELFLKLFNAGEITKISAEISKLSGFDVPTQVAEIKN